MHISPRTLIIAAALSAAVAAFCPAVAQAAAPSVAGSPGGSPAGSSAGSQAGDRAALMQVDARFAAEVAAKGFAAFEGFFAEDAVYLPTFQPRVEGKAAIMESFRPLFGDPKVKLTWTPLRADVAASGDLGWTTGSYEATVVDDQGSTTVRHGKYVTIWRKQPDGSWKAVLDGGSPDSPPAPARPAPAAAPPPKP